VFPSSWISSREITPGLASPDPASVVIQETKSKERAMKASQPEIVIKSRCLITHCLVGEKKYE
jgi:hypothetical protein